jgi:hypothetical protein
MKDEKEKGKEVKKDHMEVIRTNLATIAEYCGIEPYKGDHSYQSLYDYMKQAEKILSKRSNKITMEADAAVAAFIRENGKEALLKLKRDNYNLKLEDCVVGVENKRTLDVIDNHIVSRTGMVFLTPHSKMGRSQFYSSEKIIGSWHIKTMWYNIAVLLLMSIIVTVLLLTDCPGRYIRKEVQ